LSKLSKVGLISVLTFLVLAPLITASETYTLYWFDEQDPDFVAWDYNYSLLNGSPSHLSNLTDDLGDRGYTHISNFSTSLTAGSVVFSNGTKLTQDNSNLFWDDTNKRLGIGTTSPSYLLTLKPSTWDGITLVNDDDTPLVQLTADFAGVGGGEIYLSDDEGRRNVVLSARPAESNLYVCARTGNFGIGTTSPAQKLEVDGQVFCDSATAPGIRLAPNDGGTSDTTRAFFGLSTGVSQFVTGSAQHDTVLRGNSQGDLLFGLGGTEYARLTTTGLGIGTTNPTGVLSVSVPAMTDRDDDSQHLIIGNLDSDDDAGLRFGYNLTNKKGYLNVLNPGVAWGDLILQDDGGYVGIGTASPATKLDVNGNVSADYYFGDGSELTGISFDWNATNGNLNMSGYNITEVGQLCVNCDPSDYPLGVEKLQVTGSIDASAVITAGTGYGIGAQTGYTGSCVNVTYAGGLAVGCND
jgi:hypothetical protein